jgi:hypothetical protein
VLVSVGIRSMLSGAQSLSRPRSRSSLVPIYHRSTADSLHVCGATHYRGMAECIQKPAAFVRKRLSPKGYEENSLIRRSAPSILNGIYPLRPAESRLATRPGCQLNLNKTQSKKAHKRPQVLCVQILEIYDQLCGHSVLCNVVLIRESFQL